MNKLENHFASNLRYYRERGGMTQEDLAQQLQLSRNAVSYYENGRRSPDLNTLLLIAEVLDVRLDRLCSGNPENEEKRD